MPYIRSKDFNSIIYRLKELKLSSTMKNADFSEEIKRTTEVWRQTWLIQPVDEMLSIIDKILQSEKPKY